MWPTIDRSRAWFLFAKWGVVLAFFLTRILIKTIYGNFTGSAKSLDDSAKNRYFLGFHNGSRNMFVNRGMRSCLCYFSNNDAHMGWHFQGTLKLSISVLLKHIFMYLTHFLKVFFSVFNYRLKAIYVIF